MDWTRVIDGYCERTDPSYWSEPINAVTNAAFMVAAVLMWVRCKGLHGGQVLAAILFAIGIGSFLFHTHATAWAALADTTPILMFVLTYIFLANRDFWGMRALSAALLTAAYIPYSAALVPAFNLLPLFHISSVYWPLPALIFAYAFLLRARTPETAKGLAIGAAILCLSLTARSLDETLCESLPFGTHFLWHCLNALMLGWMIEVWRRHMLEAQATQG